MATSKEVDDWFRDSAHPKKAIMQRVRKVILSADKRMEECIKWKAPTFTYQGNLASFNPNTKKHVSLMFHTGAKIPGTYERLEGGGGTVKYMKFETADDVHEAKKELVAIVKAWIKQKSD